MHHHVFKGCIRCFQEFYGPDPCFGWFQMPDSRMLQLRKHEEESSGSSGISWTFAFIRAVFTFWTGCSLACFAADKCAVTMRAGQMKTGLCVVPSKMVSAEEAAAALFPTTEATYGLQHLPAEIWVGKRDGVHQLGRAVYKVEEKPLTLLSHAPGSCGCKYPAFKSNWGHKAHPSTNTSYWRISQAFRSTLWYSRLNKLPVYCTCFVTFSSAWGQSSGGGSWTWHLVLSADQDALASRISS